MMQILGPCSWTGRMPELGPLTGLGPLPRSEHGPLVLCDVPC